MYVLDALSRACNSLRTVILSLFIRDFSPKGFDVKSVSPVSTFVSYFLTSDIRPMFQIESRFWIQEVKASTSASPPHHSVCRRLAIFFLSCLQLGANIHRFMPWFRFTNPKPYIDSTLTCAVPRQPEHRPVPLTPMIVSVPVPSTTLLKLGFHLSTGALKYDISLLD